MPSWRLHLGEKEFLQSIMNQAVENVKMRDMKMCCEYACRAILGDRKMLQKASTTLRPVVLNRIKCAGVSYFEGLFKRHATFVALPKPLRGTALNRAASQLGLITRVKTVRVDAATIKEECTFATTRLKMHMVGEIGKACDSVVVHKKKRKECITRIVAQAQLTGVADVTLVWREFSACAKTMEDVALEAIASVCRLTNVYVLDIHAQTYLFPFPIFHKVLDLLTNSCIFAINMGEDTRLFDTRHFEVLAKKIMDGSLPLRRWFVEQPPGRRRTLLKCKLVSRVFSKRKKGQADNPNAWTIARRRDEELWHAGERNFPRLAWLRAPESAYAGAIAFKTDMQNQTCNWSAACKLRDRVADNYVTA
jgi:hypothetical protein